MDNIKIGDRVRSYDFPAFIGTRHRAAGSYVEGIVKGILRHRDDPARFTCDVYVIQVERWFKDDKEVDLAADKYKVYDETVYPPVNGTPYPMGGNTNGVVRCG